MKPKSKIQHEVVALSATLPPLTPAQQQWAREHCFARMGYVCKGYVWCSECGRQTPLNTPELSVTVGVDTTHTCPCCGAKLKLQTSTRRRYHDSVYYQVITTCRGYQVVRSFIAERYGTLGSEPYYEIREAVQNWINAEGHEEVIARPTAYSPSGCYDLWQFHKPMELRAKGRTHGGWGYYTDKYDIAGACIYPHRRLLPLVKRNGYTGRNTRLPENDHIRLLLTDREAEALEKNRQFALLAYKNTRDVPKFRMPHRHAIAIANRHRYIVRDATMWLDYLDALQFLGLDTHNPVYVCPRNLKDAHDKMMRRKRRIENEQIRREKARRAAEYEDQYRRDKGRYFGIAFSGDGITVSVLTSVEQIAAEGEAMHHCVYSANYYRRADSLILSARDSTGARLETLEVSLKTFKVVQSRGRCNQNTARHQDILDLLERNMNLIRKAAQTA